jgi:dipeptidyl aminopeptidase/acylaminoacyl peptidase
MAMTGALPITLGLLALSVTVAGLHLAIRRGFRAPRVVEQADPARFGLPFRAVSIPTANGRHLFGWFVSASLPGPAPAVALLHGWGGNAEMMLPLAAPLHRAGYGVLLFDARNHGRSDADSFSSMPRFAEDLDHALDWLARQPEVDPRALIALGHSVGAAAVLLAASRRRDLAAVVSIAAFAHPRSMMRRYLDGARIPQWPLGAYINWYVQRVIGHRFDAIAPTTSIREILCPVLLVHGADDTTVPVANAHAIYAERGGEHVRLLVLPGDHESFDKAQGHFEELISFLDDATRRGPRNLALSVAGLS